MHRRVRRPKETGPPPSHPQPCRPGRGVGGGDRGSCPQPLALPSLLPVTCAGQSWPTCYSPRGPHAYPTPKPPSSAPAPAQPDAAGGCEFGGWKQSLALCPLMLSHAGPGSSGSEPMERGDSISQACADPGSTEGLMGWGNRGRELSKLAKPLTAGTEGPPPLPRGLGYISAPGKQPEQVGKAGPGAGTKDPHPDAGQSVETVTLRGHSW